MKTLSLETCKKLKEVLGDEYQTEDFWRYNVSTGEYSLKGVWAFSDKEEQEKLEIAHPSYPAYTVQDILSRPFLEALGEKMGWYNGWYCGGRFLKNAYDQDDLPFIDLKTWQYEGLLLIFAYWQSQDKFEEEFLKLIEKK